MRSSVLLGVSVVAIVLVACSASEPRGAPEPQPTAKVASPIINGQLDTAHQAVVALVLQQGSEGGLCSGTIVKVDPTRHIGWVLTAAHCVRVTPVYVLQGNDFSSSSAAAYEVLDYKADSRYDGNTSSPYDIAVVRIVGVDASTPTIPVVTSPDGLAVGTAVLSVGYGRTSLASTGPGEENTIRRRVSKTLSQVGAGQIGYDMRTDGICQGDSGGPVLASGGGTEKVAGIHSYVQGDCNGFGVSVRVAPNLAFVNGELTKALPPEDCALCEKIANSGSGTCAALSRSCLADKDCKGYYECISAGNPKATCVTRFPKAEGPFLAATNCVCTTACKSTCGTSFSCRNAPKCGYKLPVGECATCIEGGCCAETTECAADGTCYLCLKNKDADPACATNAPRKKLATCVATKCSTPCADSGLAAGANPVTPDAGEPPPATTTTTTTTGCSVGAPAPAGSGPYLVALAGVAFVLARRRAKRSRA